jgi:transposase
VAAAAAGDGRAGAEAGPGTGGREDERPAGGAAGAPGRARGRDVGRALLLVVGGVRGRGEHRDDESGAHAVGLDAKKKTTSAIERNELIRATWREQVATVQPEDLVFLDETGSHLGYTPTHARAPRGQRAYATAPANRGENKTVVAALTLDGVGPLLRFDGAMTTARFEGYVRFRLAPTLRPGQVVVADNLKPHHSPVVRAAIEARGARFLPLPAYSPDFNPIEEAFSKVKQSLRRAQARTDDDLRAATWDAFGSITATDAAGWFTHCGYPPDHQAS